MFKFVKLYVVCAKDSGIERSASQLGSNQSKLNVVVSGICNRRDCGIQSMNVNRKDFLSVATGYE